MSERSRKQARRAARAVEAPQPIATARPPAQRSTFRVAQAQRQLAAELPSVVRNRSAEKLASTPRRMSAPLSAQPVVQDEAKRSPRRVAETTRAPQAKLDKGDLHLKCRPKSNKPASGGGSGRSFVPWGDC